MVGLGLGVGGRGRLGMGDIGIGDLGVFGRSGNGTTSPQIGFAHASTKAEIPVISTKLTAFNTDPSPLLL